MLLAPEEVLEQLDAVLDAAASVGVDDAETWSVQLQRRLNRLEAIVTAAVGDVDRSGSIGNARNTAAWFAHRAGLPKHRATRLVVNAKAMRSMPSVAAAFPAGEVNGDHVAVLASAHATNPEAFKKHEDDLVDVAKVDRFDLFERHVTYWRQITAPDVV